MPSLRVLSGEEVCQILEREGFHRDRQKGDHLTMQKKRDDTTITVPVPLHRELAVGTLRSIIRMSGLPRSLFEA
jgi:predicted RNA binding protein YcfA (HicA-like mRNA interferase family)